MAAEGGRPDTPLEQTLYEEPYRFEFFQAVRLFERLGGGRAPVGRQGAAPRREAVRFRTHPSLRFPASQLHRVTHEGVDEGAPPEATVAFMGLTGPLGVLPAHITELVADRARYKDTALWEFLDLFNHRLISLFYRAWERYRFTVAFERGGRDEFTAHLFGLIGMGTGGLEGRLGLRDEGLLFYAGLIAQRPHSAAATAAALGDYFGVPARLRPFTGQWLRLDDDNLCRLGRASSRLGVDSVAGTRVWDTQSKFRMVFGPLSLPEFTAFLPTGANYRPAVEFLRLMAGVELDFDVQLVLRAPEVPECRLGAAGPARPMLGWTTWLKTRPFAGDADDVVLSVNE
jgi:type VI secretion system protein ImpH